MVRSDLLAKFASDGVKKQWRIVADDGTVITNNVIVDGSVRLQEPLNTSEQLEFGSCESACFSFQIYERTRLKNKILTVYVTLDDMPEMQVGVYKVDSDKLTANRKMRDIVAYDKLHEILDADVKEWYNTILPNLDAAVSLKQFRESFLRHFDLTFDEENLISDTLTIHKTLDASETAELKGSAILPGICQLNAAFGRIRRDGSFAFVTLPPHQTEISFGLQNGAPYMEDPTYEEYDVQVIDKVVIRESDSGTETATTFSSATAAYKATKAEKDAELEQLNAQLRAYEQGGNAVLTNRKKVSAAKMSAAGWSDFGNASVDDYATVYSSTYSNADGTIAANFTPIETDRNTGDLRIIFTPAQLGEYARAVIDGTSEDWRNLKIGGFFSSISSATQAAATIRTLSEQQMALRDEIDELYVNYLKEGTNVFIIEDNFLIYDATAEQRDAIAEQIYNKVHGIYYRPFELKAPGNLCYEVGDSIKIETKYDVIDTYILERSFSGTGHCEDTYNARGTEKRNEQVASVSDQVEKLNGRYARLKKNIDGINSEVGRRLSDQNTEIRSWVTQQFDGFEAGVTEDNIVDKLNQAMTSVTVRANGIDFNSTGSFTANTKNFKVDAAGNVEINSLDAQATITGARIWASEITSSDQYSGNSTIIRDGYIQTNQIYLGSGGEYSQITPNAIALGNKNTNFFANSLYMLKISDNGYTRNVDEYTNYVCDDNSTVCVGEIPFIPTKIDTTYTHSKVNGLYIQNTLGMKRVMKYGTNDVIVPDVGNGLSCLTSDGLTFRYTRGNFGGMGDVATGLEELWTRVNLGAAGFSADDKYVPRFANILSSAASRKVYNRLSTRKRIKMLWTFANINTSIDKSMLKQTVNDEDSTTISWDLSKIPTTDTIKYGSTSRSLAMAGNISNGIQIWNTCFESNGLYGSTDIPSYRGAADYIEAGIPSTGEWQTPVYSTNLSSMSTTWSVNNQQIGFVINVGRLYLEHNKYIDKINPIDAGYYACSGANYFFGADVMIFNRMLNKSRTDNDPVSDGQRTFKVVLYGKNKDEKPYIELDGARIITKANYQGYVHKLTPLTYEEETDSMDYVYMSSKENFRPSEDNMVACGTIYAGWKDVYAYNGITQPSDERIKTDISDPNTKYLGFIRNVKPKTYKYKKGQSGRTHLGFIAQDIETLLSKCGIETYEFAGFVKTPIMSEEEPDAIEDFSYSLRYGEFIPLLLMYIKDNERRIKELEERLNGTV